MTGFGVTESCKKLPCSVNSHLCALKIVLRRADLTRLGRGPLPSRTATPYQRQPGISSPSRALSPAYCGVTWRLLGAAKYLGCSLFCSIPLPSDNLSSWLGKRTLPNPRLSYLFCYVYFFRTATDTGHNETFAPARGRWVRAGIIWAVRPRVRHPSMSHGLSRMT